MALTLFLSLIIFALAVLFSSAMAETFDVQVGPEGKLVFDPPFVRAVEGDIINFVFNSKNHTVTQSTLDDPCVPFPNGTDSGFHPVAADTNDPLPTFQAHIIDDKPVWFHCRQGNHCRAGMVFAINPGPQGSNNSFEAFQQTATGQNGTNSTAGNSTTTTTTHVVLVGEDGTLTYHPPIIEAAVGDTVVFRFMSKNHTVTQSSFTEPCVRFTDPTTGTRGFASGFRPVNDSAGVFPTFNITINDTAPIWGFCAQNNHCGSGMVFAINPGQEQFDVFQERARTMNGTGSSANSTASPTGGGGVAPTGGETDGFDDGSALAWRPQTMVLTGVVGAIIAWAF